MLTKEQKTAIIAEGAAEEAKEKANATFEDSIKDLSDEEKTTKRSEREATEGDKVKVDFKKIRDAEKLRRENAEQALADKRFKSKDKKKEDGEGEGEDDPEKDKPATRGDLEAALKKTTEESEAREIAKKLTGDDANQLKAVLEFWKKNPLSEVGTLEEQIKFVVGGLNSGVLLAKNAELKRALAHKNTTVQVAGTEHKIEIAEGEPEIEPLTRQTLAVSGFKWDGKLKLFFKPVANGKKNLFYDPVSKKRYTK